MSCVASVGSVTIDTEARTGPAKSLNQTERRTSALAPDFFDTIDPSRTHIAFALSQSYLTLRPSAQDISPRRQIFRVFRTAIYGEHLMEGHG